MAEETMAQQQIVEAPAPLVAPQEPPPALATDADRLRAAIDVAKSLDTPDSHRATEVEETQEAAPEGEAPATEEKKDPEVEEKKRLSPELSAIARARKKMMQSIEAEKAKVAKERAELDAMKNELAQLKAERELALQDPVGFYEKLGVKEKFSKIGEQLYYKDLGKDAPRDYRVMAEQTALARKAQMLEGQIEEMKKFIASNEQQRQEQQVIGAYEAEIRKVASQASDELSFVKTAMADRPDWAVNQMLNLAYQHAAKNPNAQPLTPQELVEQLDEIISDSLSPWLKTAPKTQAPTGNEKTLPSKTLSASQTATLTKPRLAPATDEERVRAATRQLEEFDRLKATAAR